MSGFKYVGADYTEDSNSADVVTRLDAQSEFTASPISQASASAQIATAAAGYVTQPWLNTQLSPYAESITTGLVYTVAVQYSATTTGTYTLTYGSFTTAAISPGATAASIQAAFNNTLTVTGPSGGPYTVTLNSVTSTLTATSSLTNGSVTVNPGGLVPNSWVGQYVAPLNSSGQIPSQYVPSLGDGYCQGPYGPTYVNSTTSPATTTPVKFADWNIGPVRLSFQPVVFMSLLASAVNGGRPVVEVVISSGGAPSSPTANGVTLVARGVGRNCWNDPTGSVVTVLPIPAGTGHTGLAGTGYPNGYNAWLSAWIYDANGQGASVASSNIQSAAVYFIRYANP